jgi:excisionase family DNA binding protein
MGERDERDRHPGGSEFSRSQTVYRALERRELRAAKFGSAWRIRQADADGWFEGSVPHTPPPRPDTRSRARRVSRPGSLRALEAT